MRRPYFVRHVDARNPRLYVPSRIGEYSSIVLSSNQSLIDIKHHGGLHLARVAAPCLPEDFPPGLKPSPEGRYSNFDPYSLFMDVATVYRDMS